MKDRNGTQAAIRAGYSKKTANVIASQNLSKLYIKDFIDSLEQDTADAARVTARDVLEGLLSEANNADNNGGIRTRAWELVGKHIGFFKEDNVREENITVKKGIDWDDITDDGIEKIIAAIKGA